MRYVVVVGGEGECAQWQAAGCSLFEASFGHLSGGRLTYPTSMTEGVPVKVLWGAQRTEKYTVDPHIIDLREINQFVCLHTVCFDWDRVDTHSIT